MSARWSERWSERWSDRKDDVRGAIAVLIALSTCFVLFPLASFAVDIGMQRIARRDMQSVADVTAMDMAGTLSSGTAPTDALATASARRSQGTLGANPTVRVYSGHVASANPVFISDQSLGCGGAGSAYNGYFQNPSAAGKTANAVLVTASTTVSFSMYGRSGSVCRSAIAGAVGFACYSVGSYAAAVQTSNAALIDPLMRQLAQQSGAFSNGGAVSALSYTGLAQSSVSLGRLATNLGLASVSELATAKVNLNRLYVAALDAMALPKNSTSVSALNILISTTSSSTTQVDLAKILSIDAGAGSVADASMNLLDLVGGSLGVINGTNVASLNVGSTLPGIANANFQATLIQGPHQFCGAVGSQATTATSASLTRQLGVTSTATLAPVNAAISVPAIPGLTGATTATVALPNNVSTDVSVAPTSTTLRDIRCTPASGISLDVSNGLATVTLETDLSNVSVTSDLLNVNLLGIGSVSISAKITVNAHVKVTATVSPSGVVSVSINVPNQSFDTFYPTTNTGVGLGAPTITAPSIQIQAAQNLNILGIGISLGASLNLSASDQSRILNNIVSSVVTPLFDTSNTNSYVNTVVNPVLGLLGIQTGGADVALNGTPKPTCNQPVLKG